MSDLPLPATLRAVRKPKAYRDLGPVAIDELKRLVSRISERTWDEEDRRKENDFSVFHHTRHLVFRFTPNNRTPLDFYSTPAWEVWSPLLLPVMTKVIRPYGFALPEFPKVMLARLAAGHRIDTHRDGAGSNLLTHKIHVPLQTNPDALFESGGIVRHLPLGEAIEVNNIGRHGAINNGSEDRIHLIFEVFDAQDAQSGQPPRPDVS